MQSEASLKAGPTLPILKKRSCMRSKDWTLGQRNGAPTEKQVLSIAKAQGNFSDVSSWLSIF